MAGAAAQQQVQKTSSSVNQQPANQQTGKGKPVKKTISQGAGIGIMAILLIASLFIGNFRALQKVTPTAFLKQGDVSSIVEDRSTAAKNAETVAKRANLDSSYYDAVDSAIKEFEDARNAREISRADQKLTAAVSEMTAAAKNVLDTTDQTNIIKAVDNFTEEGSFLRQEARSYNEKADRAVTLYNQLPTSFLLSEPDYYEGL